MSVQTKSATSAEIAERIKSVLETRGLTLYQVCRKAESSFGHASPHCLPHNLYYGVKFGTFSPSLYQLFALSRITDYRLADWLRVFGFDLEQIPRLQVLLPTKRTVLLDSEVSDRNAWIPWFQDRPHDTPVPQVAPLSELLEAGPPVRRRSLIDMNKQRFLYAKVGLEGALAFPDLLPSSIVRVDHGREGRLPEATRIPSNRLFLIEHGRGLSCCRLLAAGGNRVLMVSAHLPYAQIEFELHREVRILGVIDLEIRPLTRFEQPQVPKDLAKRWKPVRLPRGTATLSHLLGDARTKAGLSLRAASDLSQQIAAILEDQHYFMSPSSLSDYEARDTPAHHIQKVITLCLLYAVPFHTFLNAAGIPAAKAGQEAIPDRLMPTIQLAPRDYSFVESDEPATQGFLGELQHRCAEVPVFLRGAIASLCGLASPSLRSFFWIGGIRSPIHPFLTNGLLVSVDRHRQKPIDSRSRPPWQQSLYIVLKRDGTYLCGPCGIENGNLVMYPDAEHLELREQFRNRRDAEVVGQVIAIARRLL